MRNKKNLSTLVDLIVGAANSIAFAIIPVVLEGRICIIIIILSLIFIVFATYLIFWREMIVRRIQNPHGIDISKLQKERIRDEFWDSIIPRTVQLCNHPLSDSDISVYHCYHEWISIATFICQNFWDGRSMHAINIVSKKPALYYSEDMDSVYPYDILVVITSLLYIFNEENQFQDIIENYSAPANRLLEIQNKAYILEKIQTEISNKTKQKPQKHH